MAFVPDTATDKQIHEMHGDPAPSVPVLSPSRKRLPPSSSPLDRIAELMGRGITPEQLDKFLEVQQKYEAEQARRAYVRAMAQFKAEPIEAIKKSKSVRMRLKNKQTGEPSGAEISYKQETLGQVVRIVIPALGRHGFSHSWDVVQSESDARVIRVACVVTHEAGHSERRELRGPPDESGQKNPLQQIRSTVTYLQRATLLLATGLAAEDGSDDDGRKSHPSTSDEPRVSGKATAKQRDLIKKCAGSDVVLANALAKVDCDSLDDLPFEKVNMVLEALQK